MINLNSALNERIARITRKEIRRQVGGIPKTSAKHRRDIAFLKKQVKELSARLTLLEKISVKAVKHVPTPLPDKVRFSAKSVAAQRKRLGLSAKAFGKLVGVSGLTIYAWEKGKSRPRQQKMAKIVAVRGIGKKEAAGRLEIMR